MLIAGHTRTWSTQSQRHKDRHAKQQLWHRSIPGRITSSRIAPTLASPYHHPPTGQSPGPKDAVPGSAAACPAHWTHCHLVRRQRVDIVSSLNLPLGACGVRARGIRLRHEKRGAQTTVPLTFRQSCGYCRAPLPIYDFTTSANAETFAFLLHQSRSGLERFPLRPALTTFDAARRALGCITSGPKR
jgi:hypothetical protein